MFKSMFSCLLSSNESSNNSDLSIPLLLDIHNEIVLSEEQMKDSTRKIKGATDKCLECGASNHFIGNCPVLNNQGIEGKP